MIHNTFTKAEWHIPTRILLGEGRINDIEAQLEYYKIKSPVIICDKLLTQHMSVKNLLRKLDGPKYSFGIISQNMTYVCEEQIKYIDDMFYKSGFDCIIAYGTSPIITLARLVGKQKQIPVFIIPLTAGDTREFSNYVLVAQGDKKNPKVILHALDFPTIVIFDTLIASIQNKALIIDSALAILVSAVETWCSNSFDPVSDSLSFEATKIIFNQLPQLINNPSNAALHAHVLSAAAMAGLATTKQHVGASTLLAQCLSVLYGVSYGKTAGLLLPHVLSYHLKIFDQRLVELANRLGIKGGSIGFAKTLLKLRRKADVPSKLTDHLGLEKMKRNEKKIIEEMVDHYAATDISATRLTKKAVLTILNAAIAGKMKRK